MKERTYARKLTKEELMKSGITAVTKDGHVFKGEEELIPKTNKQGYFIHFIYDFDENGNYIKVPNAKSIFGYNYKMRSIGLHRLMWAWFNNEVPDGMVVDHISNEHTKLEDYELTNLQLLTPRENLTKDKTNWNAYELKCKLNKPRSFYENKLAHYEALHEQAKLNHDAEAAHKFRTNISQSRARLRYYDNHISEALDIQLCKEQEESKKKDYHERAQKKKELKANVDSARKFYKEITNAYGKDDLIVKKYWYEWKLAIAEYYMFCADFSAEPKTIS